MKPRRERHQPPKRASVTIPDVGKYLGAPVALFARFGKSGTLVWLDPDERELFEALDISDNEDFYTYQSLRREAETRRRQARSEYGNETLLERLEREYEPEAS
jgi:hypothetical protein